MGFLPPIRQIVKALPQKRQTLMFSATLSREIEALTHEFQRSPKVIEIGRRANPAETVTQLVYEVNQQRLHSVDDFRRLVTQAGESAATRLLVRRGRNDFYVAMDFGGVPMPRRPAPNSRDTLLRT